MAGKKGLEILSDHRGEGAPVHRHAYYRIKLRMWLRRGEPVRWKKPWGLLNHASLEDDDTTMTTEVRIDRVFLVAGLFYGIQEMNVGGTRLLRMAPHLAYGNEGIPGVIPPNALLTVELSVLAERPEYGLH